MQVPPYVPPTPGGTFNFSWLSGICAKTICLYPQRVLKCEIHMHHPYRGHLKNGAKSLQSSSLRRRTQWWHLWGHLGLSARRQGR
jgi:hypothetical protein